MTLSVSPQGEINPNKILYRIEVQDTGRGIVDKVLPTLFEPFSKAHNYHPNEGSGLGLSIAKRFAEALGGHVGVVSEPGRGSTFWVEIPLKTARPGSPGQFHLLSIDSSWPIPMFAVCVREKTFGVLAEYLSFWNVPFEVVSTPQHLAGFTHAIVEENHPACPQVEAFLDTMAGNQQRVIFLSTFPTYYAVKAMKEARGIKDRLSIISSPLTPLKISKAFAAVLGLLHHLVDCPDTPALSSPSSTKITTDGGSSSSSSARLRVATSSGKQTSPSSRSSLDILLVEDNPVTQLVFRKQFEKLQISFVIVGSAEDAITTWKKYKDGVSLIMMDVELDGPMTGLEATAALRDLERMMTGRSRSYVAIMTGRSLEEDRREAFESGCDEFLVKPLSLNQTKDLIDRICIPA